MKKLFYLIGLSLVFISCDKEEEDIELLGDDYREQITGNYTGIMVTSILKDTIIGFEKDTSNVEIVISLSDLDSIVDLEFNPSNGSDDFSFKYMDGELISTAYYHPPVATVNTDSLYIKHQPSLGPNYYEFFTKKD